MGMKNIFVWALVDSQGNILSTSEHKEEVLKLLDYIDNSHLVLCLGEFKG